MTEIWDIWFPQAGATGISFARSRVDHEAAGDRLLVHAAPPAFNVSVRDAEGNEIARGTDLERHEKGPMSTLVRRGSEIAVEGGWPSDADLGRLVILPGGEAGILQAWWHAPDHSEWRWQIEFYNHV